MAVKFRFNKGMFILGMTMIAIVAWAIVTQIRENHQQDEMLAELKKQLVKVSPAVAEATNGVAWYSANKSYTINKEKVHMCLRDEKGAYYDKNMLIYVALHELAHVMQDSIGHTQQFHRKFAELLRKAAANGVYDPSQPPISDYCN